MKHSFSILVFSVFYVPCVLLAGFFEKIPPTTLESQQWLKKANKGKAPGCELSMSLTGGHVVNMTLKAKNSKRVSSGNREPYILPGVGVLVDDLLFDPVWHPEQPKGLRIIFVADDKRVYGCVAEMGYKYGWTGSVSGNDLSTQIIGLHARLLKDTDMLKRSLDVRPYIDRFLSVFPNCKPLHGKFLIVAHVGLIAPTENSIDHCMYLFQMVEIDKEYLGL
jgi:hypothetical protein